MATDVRYRHMRAVQPVKLKGKASSDERPGEPWARRLRLGLAEALHSLLPVCAPDSRDVLTSWSGMKLVLMIHT